MEAFQLHRELQLGHRWRQFPLKLASRRLERLRLSNQHYFGFRDNGLQAMLCVDIDPAEREFLLCGSINGAPAIVDLREGASTSKTDQCLMLKVLTSRRSRGKHKHAVTSCQWFPVDSSVFATASVDKHVKLWDANVFSVVEKFQFDEEVKSIHWSPHGASTEIAIGLDSSNIHFIDIRSGDSAQELRWKDTVNTVQWSPSNANILASGGQNGRISIWDKRSGKSELRTFYANTEITKKGHRHHPAIGGLRFSADGLFLVGVDLSKLVHVWSTPTYKHIGAERINLYGEDRRLFGVDGVIRFDVSGDEVGDLWAFVPAATSVMAMKLINRGQSGKVNDTVFRLQGSLNTVNACAYRPHHQQVISVSKDGSGMLFEEEKEIADESQRRKILTLMADNWSDSE